MAGAGKIPKELQYHLMIVLKSVTKVIQPFQNTSNMTMRNYATLSYD